MENSILNICSNNYHNLIKLPNVLGVGLGFKYINEINTCKPCISVLVEKKVSKNCLSKETMIPNTYMNFSTDVFETGKIYARALKNRIRPLQGGYSVSPNLVHGGGTLGCIVYRKIGTIHKDYFVLSNNHVLTNLNKLAKGTLILQPAYTMGGRKPNDVIGTLQQFENIKFLSTFSKPENLVDCAIAKIDSSLKTNIIALVGKVRGTTVPLLGLSIQKVGAQTGLTKGKITHIGVTLDIEFENNKHARFKNQIVSDNKSDTGDSGSVLMDHSNYVTGLLCGGSEQVSVSNDIRDVLKVLNVKIYT